MKKFIALLIILSAFTSSASAEVLTVFAAASMQYSLEKISSIYTNLNPDVEIVYNFDSSGTLKTQIIEGADCDLFISAAQKQMNALDKAGLIDSESRINLLENKIVLVVPEGNPAKINSYDDLKSGQINLIALGNSDVPVGAYSQEILTNMGIWDKLNSEKKISFASNVTEVAMQVRESVVDCGIVYATDAATHKLMIIGEAPAGMLKTPVIYPAAIIKNAKNPVRAKNFLEFLQSSQAIKIFSSIVFSMAK